MCDDSKWAKPKTTTAGGAAATSGPPDRGGKPSGIKDMKICPQLDRTKWSQRLPRGHDEDVCHMVSQKRRGVLRMMKQLVDEQVDQ